MADHRGGRPDRAVQPRLPRHVFADRTGQTIPLFLEELFWGDAGIGLSIMGSVLGAVGIMSQGTPEQVGE